MADADSDVVKDKPPVSSKDEVGKETRQSPRGKPSGERDQYHHNSRHNRYERPRNHGSSSGHDKVRQDQERDSKEKTGQRRGRKFKAPPIKILSRQDEGKGEERVDASDKGGGLSRSEQEQRSGRSEPIRQGRVRPRSPYDETTRSQVKNDKLVSEAGIESVGGAKDTSKKGREPSQQDTGDREAQTSSRDERSHHGRGRYYQKRNSRHPQNLQREKTRSQDPTADPDMTGSTSEKKMSDSAHRGDDPPQSRSADKAPSGPPRERRNDRNDYTKQKHTKPQSQKQSQFKGQLRDQRSALTLQSDQLTQELTAGTYECMVCCERVRGRDQVWSCERCYHVFHLKCIKKWASAPVLGAEEGTADGWQCPSCRRTSTIVPTVYRCFCGRVVNPRPKGKGELTVPHSCGDICLKSLAVGPGSSCRHKCRLLCHPGPCPPCPVMVTRTCPCGKKTHQVRCSRTGALPSCGGVCGRGLLCGRHSCEDVCHSEQCRTCEKVLTQQCHCGRETRQSVCGKETSLVFSCGRVCNKELDCGNHLCEQICHEGACQSCSLLPSAVTTCPCGAMPLSKLLAEGEERVSCFDPVPTCDRVCGKILPCSVDQEDPHCCPAQCHLGACPPCDKTSSIRCVCGATSMSIPCVEVVSGKGVELKCGRVCNKKKSCGRHRCSVRCCMDVEHKCELLCGKKLQCGLHQCQENCHRGHCGQCWEYSYTELTCHCGAEVIHPPIPCGTRPPSCTRLCARMHPCGHPVNHSCHSDDACPPCTFLTEKMCVGGHELRRNVPCHLTDVSCGVVCGRPLPCDMHKCQRTCHRGNCDELPCQQPCSRKRKLCDHPCGESCHVGRACPDTPCQAFVVLKCGCGRRKEKVVCMASESGSMRQAFQMFSKDLGSSGETINISAVTATNRSRQKPLECDEVCRQVLRNKTLAAALEIKQPIIDPLESGSLGDTAHYSPYLVEEARSNLEFVVEVEEKLKALVDTTLKGPPTKTHKYSFRPMKSNQRRIIHELSVHYGCETTSFDPEPMRNVTVFSTKSQAKIPPVSLAKFVDRDRYKPPPAPLHVMTVSERTSVAKKLTQLGDVPDYFADDLKL